jgi:hypothetical protein
MRHYLPRFPSFYTALLCFLFFLTPKKSDLSLPLSMGKEVKEMAFHPLFKDFDK